MFCNRVEIILNYLLHIYRDFVIWRNLLRLKSLLKLIITDKLEKYSRRLRNLKSTFCTAINEQVNYFQVLAAHLLSSVFSQISLSQKRILYYL